MIPHQWFLDAQARIGPHIKVTPLTYDPEYNLYMKWENHQVTGSFKTRGAFNKILSLEKWEQEAGFVTASAGNHGQGVALAARFVNAPAVIFASQNAPPVKIRAMRKLGAEVRLVSGGYGDAENAALEFASSSNANWISAYNDGPIIAGQGTLGLEVSKQLRTKYGISLVNTTWLVPVGGGGLIAGIATALKQIDASVRVIGIQTDTSPFFHALFHHGTQDGIQEYPTIADGLAGPVEDGSITVPIIKQYVDDIVLVSDEDTEEAIAFSAHHYGERIEGAAAVTLAAVLTGKINSSPVVAILSGGNIQDTQFNEIVKRKI